MSFWKRYFGWVLVALPASWALVIFVGLFSTVDGENIYGVTFFVPIIVLMILFGLKILNITKTRAGEE